MGTPHADGYHVVSLQWIGWGGWLVADVAYRVGLEDAVSFLLVTVGVGAGSFSGGAVASMLETTGSTCYCWAITE